MNQILLTNNQNNKKKSDKYNSNNSGDMKKIIIFFGMVILIFAVFIIYIFCLVPDINQGVYNLKADGTYVVENKEESGVFTINENTITFIQMKHTVGPRDQDPYFNDGVSRLITDDCSKILLTSTGSETTAYLQKVN